VSAGPQDVERIDLPTGPEAEMKCGWTLGEETRAQLDLSENLSTVAGHRHLGAGRERFGFDSLEVDQQHITLSRGVVAVDLDRGVVAVVDEEIQVAVAVEVGGRGPSTVQAQVETQNVADLIKRSVAPVLEERIGLATAPGQALLLQQTKVIAVPGLLVAALPRTFGRHDLAPEDASRILGRDPRIEAPGDEQVRISVGVVVERQVAPGPEGWLGAGALRDVLEPLPCVVSEQGVALGEALVQALLLRASRKGL